MWENIFLALVGGCAGLLAAGGVFTVLISIGLVPRFAGKTHTSRKVTLYENFIVAGTIIGCIASVFPEKCQFGAWIVDNGILSRDVWNVIGTVFLIVFGVFAGIFVGCFALAIAEMLNTIPIFARRVAFRHGLGIAILSMAAGKLVGSLIYFAQGVAEYGGR